MIKNHSRPLSRRSGLNTGRRSGLFWRKIPAILSCWG